MAGQADRHYEKWKNSIRNGDTKAYRTIQSIIDSISAQRASVDLDEAVSALRSKTESLLTLATRLEISMQALQNYRLHEAAQRSKGRSKLKTLIRLIQAIPENDQALVFVQNIASNDKLMQATHSALRRNGINSSVIFSSDPKAASILEDFKNNTTEERSKVLILNLDNESSAGR